MRRILISFVFVLFLISFASASINFQNQPNPVYSFGDKVNTTIQISPNPDLLCLLCLRNSSINFQNQPNPVYSFGDKVNTTIQISPNPDFNEVVSMDLVCGSNKIQVYKEFLSTSEIINKNIVVPILSSLVGNLTGECDFQVYAGNNLATSSQTFKISKLVKIEFLNLKDSFKPGEKVILNGSAVKENGENVNGEFYANFEGKNFSGAVTNGGFSGSFEIPSNLSAGSHKLSFSIDDKSSSGEILNSGEKISFLNILSVPTSVEVLLTNKSVLPGESLTGKVVLHDQTGKNIPNLDTYVAIKDSSGNIIKKITTKTDAQFEYLVEDSQAPATFEVSAYSAELINSAQFNILEKREITSKIVNRTLTLTNTGNVFYEGNLTLQIGKDNVSIPLSLPVGSSEDYMISAPDGEYNVVVGDFSKTVSLSGNAVQVQKLDQTISSFPTFLWIFIILILALGAYLVFKKGYKPHIFVRSKKQREVKKLSEVAKVIEDNSIFDSKKEVELSLSIVGTKQNATVGCISVKNYPEISSGKGNVKETFLSIERLVEENKGFVYQNGSYFFYVLAPAITKTFKNQKTGVLVSQKIKNILNEHNKKFKQRIEFGISINYGTIITKVEKTSIKFMSLGTLLTMCKKLASFSEGEVIVSDKLSENMEDKIKGELVQVGTLKGYKLENLVDKDSHSTFIKGFVARQERDKAKEQEKQDKESKN